MGPGIFSSKTLPSSAAEVLILMRLCDWGARQPRLELTNR